MRRAAWIFLAAILLPSLGLAWLAIRSAQDQQIVLEHQQVIISQNITDALAKDLQSRMERIRADFVKATQQLLDSSASASDLAENFNQRLADTWPMAEIGFAVNVDGDIYSPKTYDGPAARTFRDENGRFLSNRENVEVYSSNSLYPIAQNAAGLSVGGAVLDSKLAAAPIVQGRSAYALDTLKAVKDNEENDALQMVKKQEPVAAAGNAVSAPAVSAPVAAPAAPAADLESQAVVSDSLAKVPMEEQKTIQLHAATPPPADVSSTTTATNSASRMAQTPADAPSSQAQSASSGTTQLSPAPAGSTPLSGLTDASSSVALPSFNITQKIQRNVVPQQMLARQSAALSNSVPEESDFRRVIGTEASGELARFLENKLRLLVWSHAPADSPIVFGAQLNTARVVDSLRASFQIPELAQDGFTSQDKSGTCVAILDDTGHPVALSIPNFQSDWKHPFVATEIGDALPHWEAALYLVDPQQFSRAAQTLRATIALIVLVLIAVIVSGGTLIAADVRRQVRLAQQKTDFVSNVSHELKTPLTSIRMFADLLAEKRVPDEERQATYLRIIAAEAARLTRLINNVLDFARLERGKSTGEPRPCDLVEAVRDVVETCAPHLEAAGITFRYEIESESLPIRGELDALAQIILNLISNAEKYGGNDVLVRVRRQDTATGALGCVDVLDRGAGIPAREVKTVFEPFHRLDDSLASGIPGSGLGLTLARRMARGHGGDVTYSPRAGGGSCFTLTIPLAAPA